MKGENIMKDIIFKGCGTAIATPFTRDGVNFEEFGKLLEFQISEGADAIIVCGTTGESATMTDEERKQTIKYAIDKVAGRIPVIAGTGSNNTTHAIEMSKYAESVGADGLLIVTPYYNKTTQAGLVAHYKSIANEVKLPIIVYSVPSRTGVNINPETCLELSKIPNIVAIKEASGNISQIAKIAELCKEDLNIYSGNDDQVIPILSLGGIGVISVLSNIEPKFTHEMIENYINGNRKLALDMQLKAIPLIEALFCEVNPIPVKEALNLMGYNYGIPRLPLVEMSDKGKEKIKSEMKNFGTI
jgi:4-hydroxy-tetrahydrodipicolinate synthase